MYDDPELFDALLPASPEQVDYYVSAARNAGGSVSSSRAAADSC